MEAHTVSLKCLPVSRHWTVVQLVFGPREFDCLATITPKLFPAHRQVDALAFPTIASSKRFQKANACSSPNIESRTESGNCGLVGTLVCTATPEGLGVSGKHHSNTPSNPSASYLFLEQVTHHCPSIDTTSQEKLNHTKHGVSHLSSRRCSSLPRVPRQHSPRHAGSFEDELRG